MIQAFHPLGASLQLPGEVEDHRLGCALLATKDATVRFSRTPSRTVRHDQRNYGLRSINRSA